MEHRLAIREFLVSRRAKITPQQAGLPDYGGHRRVQGLRREEVAMLSGVSVDYYNRLERGALAGASEGILEAIARALQLDEAESEHLFALAAAARKPARSRAATPRRGAPKQLRPTLYRVLEGFVGIPAIIRNGNRDILATNALGRALYSPIFDSEVARGNIMRFAFLDPRGAEYFGDWQNVASDCVAALRIETGRRPDDPTLMKLIGELSAHSELFRTRWAAHNVKFHRTGVKFLHHPAVGALELEYESFALPNDEDLALNVYTAAPNSATADSLTLLASWAAAELHDAGSAERGSTEPFNTERFSAQRPVQ